MPPLFSPSTAHPDLLSFPTRRSSDLGPFHVKHYEHVGSFRNVLRHWFMSIDAYSRGNGWVILDSGVGSSVINAFYRVTSRLLSRSEEHTSELQSRFDIVCRLLLEKKK